MMRTYGERLCVAAGLALVVSGCDDPFSSAGEHDGGGPPMSSADSDGGAASATDSLPESAADDTAEDATISGEETGDADAGEAMTAACSDDEYESAEGCMLLTRCAADEFEAVPPTKASDRVCKQATVCDDDRYVSTELTTNADRVCSPISECTEDEYESAAPTKSSDRECSPLTKCTKDEYESTRPSPTSDRVCLATTQCTADEYETVEASDTADRQCAGLTLCGEGEYESTAPTPTTDRECSAVTVCSATEFEAAAPTATSDRTCQALTLCDDSEYESAPPSDTSDRQCNAISECDAGTYETAAPSATSNRQCTPLSVCGQQQFETLAPSPTSDRQCQDLTLCSGNQYETVSSTPTSDRQCSALSACDSSEYESAAPSPTTDRECASLTECSAAQYESIGPTPTADRECLLARWQLGSTGRDTPYSVALGPDGYLFIAGFTQGDLDGDGPADNAGGSDAFVVKVHRDGSIVWRQQFGTTENDTAFSVVVDSEGNAIVAGVTDDDLDGNGPGEHLGDTDAFLAKFDANGERTWLRQFGSTDADLAYFVALDSDDRTAVTGSTYGDMDDSGAGAASSTGDGFVTIFDADGTRDWTRQWGTDESDLGITVAIDRDDNVVVAGTTTGDLDADGPDDVVGNGDLAVLKWDPSGAPLWQRQVGSTAGDLEPYVSCDLDGNVLVAASTAGDFDGSGAGTFAGQTDAVVITFTSLGEVSGITQFGTNQVDYVTGSATDADGNVFVIGYTTADLDGMGGDAALGNEDVFVAKLQPSGTPEWTRQFGTSGSDAARGLVVVAEGGLAVVGSTAGDIDGAGSGSSFGGEDVFVAGFNAAGNL